LRPGRQSSEIPIERKHPQETTLSASFNRAWMVGWQDSKPCPARGAHWSPTRYTAAWVASINDAVFTSLTQSFAPSKLQEHVCCPPKFCRRKSRSAPLGSTLTTLNSMQRCGPASGDGSWLFSSVCSTVLASGQMPAPSSTVTFTVVDEDGLLSPMPRLSSPSKGHPPSSCEPITPGRCAYSLQRTYLTNFVCKNLASIRAWETSRRLPADRRSGVGP